jgi:hypothetical protein
MYLLYEDARKVVRNQRLKNKKEWDSDIPEMWKESFGNFMMKMVKENLFITHTTFVDGTI